MTEVIQTLLAQPLQYGVFSNGKGDAVQYKQIRFRALGARYQFERYTEKQVFHDFCERAALGGEFAALFQTGYRQLDAWDGTFHYTVKVSKKGKYTLLKQKDASHAEAAAHNREKQYLLKEGEAILPLVDLGVFTKEGRVVHSMYDKFRQINRFTELVRDGLGRGGANAAARFGFWLRQVVSDLYFIPLSGACAQHGRRDHGS